MLLIEIKDEAAAEKLSQQMKCLCWSCGREILENEPTHEINEERWCGKCYTSLFDDLQEYDYDD